MLISKQSIDQIAITAVITFIVAAVGVTMFGADAALYSGIAAGLSVTVGKEYGDALAIENSWHWKDVVPGVIGVIIGILACLILNLIR